MPYLSESEVAAVRKLDGPLRRLLTADPELLEESARRRIERVAGTREEMEHRYTPDATLHRADGGITRSRHAQRYPQAMTLHRLYDEGARFACPLLTKGLREATFCVEPPPTPPGRGAELGPGQTGPDLSGVGRSTSGERSVPPNPPGRIPQAPATASYQVVRTAWECGTSLDASRLASARYPRHTPRQGRPVGPPPTRRRTPPLEVRHDRELYLT